MKKNPLSDIYENKVLLNEEKDNVVQDAKKLDAMIDAKKAQPVAGQGAEKVKDLEEPEELKKYSDGSKAKAETLKDSVEAPKAAFEGSFERLFKATINEDVMEEEPAMDMEMDVEVPTSNEEMVDELEDKEDEVSDLVSDLKSVMDHLQSILDKISNEVESKEEGEEGEEEMEFGGEEDAEVEDEPVKEATELKPLGDKGKVLMGKNNKVGGAPKVHGGKAHGGDVESDPKLKPAKAHDKALQSPKAKPEVKSTVKVGEFFK
jgi:hypothetical protein